MTRRELVEKRLMNKFGGQFKYLRIVNPLSFNHDNVLVGSNIKLLSDINYHNPIEIVADTPLQSVDNEHVVEYWIQMVENKIDYLIKLNTNPQHALTCIDKSEDTINNIANPTKEMERLHALKWKI